MIKVNFILFLAMLLNLSNLHAQMMPDYWQAIGKIKKDGIALGFEKTILSKSVAVLNLQTELTNLRHSKETKTENSGITEGRPYTFGKLNKVYLWKVGINLVKPISGSFNQMSDVSVLLGVGPQLVMLQPQYIQIYRTQNDGLELATEKYSAENHANQEYIVGNAPWHKGLSEMTFKAGAYLKVGVNYNWYTSTRARREIAAGINLDFFMQNIPILHQYDHQRFQPGVFVAYKIGKAVSHRI